MLYSAFFAITDDACEGFVRMCYLKYLFKLCAILAERLSIIAKEPAAWAS